MIGDYTDRRMRALLSQHHPDDVRAVLRKRWRDAGRKQRRARRDTATIVSRALAAIGLDLTMEAWERERLARLQLAIDLCAGDKSAAARVVGMHRRTLQRTVRK